MTRCSARTLTRRFAAVFVLLLASVTSANCAEPADEGRGQESARKIIQAHGFTNVRNLEPAAEGTWIG